MTKTATRVSAEEAGVNHGLAHYFMVERLGGVETGHAELLDWIDRWLHS